MSINNDQLVNEMLEAENNKIPSLFKLSKVTARIALAAIVVFFLLSMTFIVFFYRSGSTEMIQQGEAYTVDISVYNNDYIRYAVICLAVVIVVAFWLFMVQYYEKRAYAKASEFADKLHYAEMHKNEDRFAQERYTSRHKTSATEDPAFWTFRK